MLSRRDLIVGAARCLPAAAGAVLVPLAWPPDAAPAILPGAGDDWTRTAVKARYWTTSALAADCSACHGAPVDTSRAHRHDPATVRCLLCAQGCTIKPGARGRCRARVNLKGELRSLTYGRPVAVHLDPIEKKPFYHFLPGVTALSFGSSGCPLQCRFCQNWELSQSSPGDLPAPFTPPAEVARAAADRRAPVIAFTYNEPTTFVEYLLDVADAARGRGVRSVMVSCGLMSGAPLADMCAALSAIKIDLKGFSEKFYREICGAELKPVLRSIGQVAKSRAHLEIVNLVVPTLNDSDKELQALARWLAGEVGRDVPVHFTRFHPAYQLLNLPPTPVATLERARDIALAAGLRYAYVGNVPGHAGNHTYCPGCRKVVVRRDGFFVSEMNVRHGKCRFCQHPIAGVWS